MSVRLTQLAKRAGCAAKHPPGYLFPLLRDLPPITDPNVLVGTDTADDVPGDVVADGCAEVYFCLPIVDGGVCPMNSLCNPSECPDAQCEIEAV